MPNGTPALNRRASDADHLILVAAIDDLRAVQAEMQREQAETRLEVKKSSELQAVNNAKTEEIYALFVAAKGAFTVLGWIGTFIKWTAAVAGAGVAIWAFFYALIHGFPPK